ncbi:tyrosine-type recombinase/integrase, partial [Propionivibrio sp.]|uniref:tyrosine-type recombinase/integrase n=1 Tax=Propionivibrio sp. TaxID=2212460 RepID=UPI003BF33EF9
MQRKIRFTRKALDCLPPCPATHPSGELEYTSLESPPGLRLVVTKRGIKSWLLRYTIATPGQPGLKRAIKIGVFPGLDPADACRIALDLRAQIAHGIDPLEARQQKATEPTLNEFFRDEYLPNALATLRSAKDVESRWRLHLSPAFGSCRFNDLRTADILRFHDAKRAQCCPATANRLLALLKRVINVAIMLERCERNPVKGIRMHPENNIRKRTLAGDELKRFVDALAEEPNRVAAAFILFALTTAARREECSYVSLPEIFTGVKQPAF